MNKKNDEKMNYKQLKQKQNIPFWRDIISNTIANRHSVFNGWHWTD